MNGWAHESRRLAALTAAIGLLVAGCGPEHRTATFGETRTSTGARTVPIASCKVYNGPKIPNVLNDWAYCKLSMPVNDVPIIPILMGCETDILKPGQNVVV